MPNFRTLLPGFVKQMQYNVLKIKTAAKQRVYPKKSSHPKKYLPNFPTQKDPGIENFKPKNKSFHHPRHLKSGEP